MAKNQIPDGKVFRFGDMELHGNLMQMVDSHKPRNAVHEYLKRDGAQIEYMGRGPKRFRFMVSFIGPNFRKQYLNTMAALDRNPKGLLVHPLLGSIPAAYDGTEGATVDISRAIDSIDLPIAFIEDRVDTNLEREAEDARSVNAKEAAVTGKSATLTAAIAIYGSVVEAAVEILTETAEEYAEVAAASVNDTTPDTSLSTRLGDVAAYANSAIRAILDDDTDEDATDASKFEAIDAVEQLFAACLEMDEAIGTQRPPMTEYTVAVTIGIGALAARIYGRDATAKIDEILSLNRIQTPHAIPGGTKLRLYLPA